MSNPVVLIKEQDGICEITINRPERYNALNNEVMLRLREAFLQFKENPNCHVCILRGAGDNFSSGADLKQFGESEAQTPEAVEQRANMAAEVYNMLLTIDKPVICSVRGYALAGGCGLAMSGDLVLASEKAVFGYPEVKRGFVPAMVMVNLARFMGRRKALELLLTGKKISARTALEWGMINEVVDDENLNKRTRELASELVAINPDGLAQIKSLYYRALDLDLSEGMECSKEINRRARKAQEFKQGLDEFGRKS